MTAAEDVAYGESPDSDEYAVAARDLTPDKSLARVAANARSTVGAVSVVGTVVTALGLVGAGEVRGSSAETAALVAAALALLALLTALLFTVPVLTPLNLSRPDEVERWFDRQFKRARLATVAAVLLILAVVVGGLAAALAVVDDRRADSPALTLALSGTEASRTLVVRASVDGLAPGDDVTLTVTPTGGSAAVISAAGVADADGAVTLEGSVDGVALGSYVARAVVNGDETHELTLG